MKLLILISLFTLLGANVTCQGRGSPLQRNSYFSNLLNLPWFQPWNRPWGQRWNRTGNRPWGQRWNRTWSRPWNNGLGQPGNQTGNQPVTIPSPEPVTSPAPPPSQGCACGRRNNNGANHRIVGGQEARKNEFSWRVALLLRGGIFACTASLIDPRWVMTAAHCVNGFASQANRLLVSIGDHDLQSNTETKNQIIGVKRVVQHRSYNSVTKDNDIALLELSTDALLSETVSPVCLPYKFKGETFSNETVTASGWGRTREGIRDSARKLMETDLNLITNQQCYRMYGMQIPITGNMICTYTHQDGQGRDTCQGDSGGSIDYADPQTKTYHAIGVVSFGDGCARENSPGVNTRVVNYLDWIEDITGRSFCGRQ